ncbi:MAG TPA: 5-(carboxyamino)imidazole ribonucleotide mutase [Planctomycetota bacterium]|nr:5-(carboxyamino)imidazole ribonucleotide mutase [Planctomycetota bacterium]
MAKKAANIRVAILMGSDSDYPVMERCVKTLRALGIPCEARVLSAHRTPAHVERYVKESDAAGVEVFVCAAGGAAALPGVVAAQTMKPVLGVPLNATPLLGLDALFAIAQMPSGIPVGTLAVGEMGASNAGFLAARILALGDPALRKRLDAHREEMVRGVLEKDANVRAKSTS